MTPAQRRIQKLGNAIRCFRGSKFSNSKWFRPPQKMAAERITRWLFRLRWHKQISFAQEAKIKAQLGI